MRTPSPSSLDEVREAAARLRGGKAWKDSCHLRPVPDRDEQEFNDCRGTTLLSAQGKVLAHCLLMLIRSQLLKPQIPEQSRFMPGASTTAHIRISGAV